MSETTEAVTKLPARELTDAEKRALGRGIYEAFERAADFARDDEIDHSNSDGDLEAWLSTCAREFLRYGWVIDERILRVFAPLAGSVPEVTS